MKIQGMLSQTTVVISAAMSTIATAVMCDERSQAAGGVKNESST